MAEESESSASLLSKIISDILYSPLNLLLLAVCIFLLHRILSLRRESKNVRPREPELPKLKKRDFTLEQLKEYSGQGPENRILVAVNGKVFDVTKGKKFYGPGGPYAAFAGRDASRGLATFSVDAFKDEYDDLSDLNTMQMESVREWEQQFSEKYAYVGKLLKPGEDPHDYSDEEDNSENKESKPSVENKDCKTSPDKKTE